MCRLCCPSNNRKPFSGLNTIDGSRSHLLSFYCLAEITMVQPMSAFSPVHLMETAVLSSVKDSLAVQSKITCLDNELLDLSFKNGPYIYILDNNNTRKKGAVKFFKTHSIPGPVLFTIYMNKLGRGFTGFHFHFYADDKVICCFATTLAEANDPSLTECFYCCFT